jgi:Zn-dependent metalloprotease
MILVKRGIASLAWRVHATGERAEAPLDKIAFIDAHSGGVLRSWNNLHTEAATGTGSGFFNGLVPLITDQRIATTSSFRLIDPSRGGHYTCDMLDRQASCYFMDDADNFWGDGKLSNRQTVAADAQYGTAVTWDYYTTIHGRSGVTNDGKGVYNRVHYSRKYNNAFWSDSCMCMSYGDGDGVTYNPFVSLDVTGHEMTHGITTRTANLTYSGESGGLNEATSDIFGTMVEYHAKNSGDAGDYLIGEKLYKTGGKSLRYMFQPSKDGKSADCWYSGVGSLGVHYSSGVANHFFYLLAEGTAAVGTTLPGSKTCNAADTRTATGTGTLTGIGRAKAEKIWYRALTVYMTSSTNYVAARTATVAAAGDLYGLSAAEVSAVAAAWTAVNVK